jgi:hypothetical protein
LAIVLAILLGILLRILLGIRLAILESFTLFSRLLFSRILLGILLGILWGILLVLLFFFSPYSKFVAEFIWGAGSPLVQGSWVKIDQNGLKWPQKYLIMEI